MKNKLVSLIVSQMIITPAFAAIRDGCELQFKKFETFNFSFKDPGNPPVDGNLQNVTFSRITNSRILRIDVKGKPLFAFESPLRAVDSSNSVQAVVVPENGIILKNVEAEVEDPPSYVRAKLALRTDGSIQVVEEPPARPSFADSSSRNYFGSMYRSFIGGRRGQDFSKAVQIPGARTVTATHLEGVFAVGLSDGKAVLVNTKGKIVELPIGDANAAKITRPDGLYEPVVIHYSNGQRYFALAIDMIQFVFHENLRPPIARVKIHRSNGLVSSFDMNQDLKNAFDEIQKQ